MTPVSVDNASAARPNMTPLAADTLLPWQWLLRGLEAASQGPALGICLLGVLLTTNWGELAELVGDGKPLASATLEFSSQTSVPQHAGRVLDVASGRLAAFYLSIAKPLSTLFDVSLLTNGNWRAWLADGLLGIWRLVVWALLGVAVCRIAAEQLTYHRRKKAGAEHASPMQRGRKTWWGVAMTPLLLLGMTALLLVPILLGGKLAEWLATPLIGLLVWPFAVALGGLAALLLCALVVGAPLLWASAAVERPDPFDALSRTLSYVYQAPVRLIAYLATAFVIGLISAGVVESVASVALGLISGAWGHPQLELPKTANASLGIASLAALTLKLLTNAFYASYFFAASTAIYLLLRRDVDDQQVDEIDLTLMATSSEEPVSS